MIGIKRGAGAIAQARKSVQALFVWVFALSIAGAPPANADELAYALEIPAQDLDGALKTLAVETDKQVLFAASDVKGHTSPEINGEYSTFDAMELLLADTGLVYEVTRSDVLLVKPNDETIAIGEATGQGGDSDSKNSSPAPVLMAQNQLSSQKTQVNRSTETSSRDSGDEIEEIVVIGSHIRGAQSASPVSIYSRDDIDVTGVSTIPDFVRTLTQNFGGGIAEGTMNAADSAGNVNFGTGVNLRGLGNDSTLVLVNGRRLAPAGLGNFVDVSMIPLLPMSRVEVLTDGASAIYGSDAIGGVINFTLQNDFRGAETRFRYGSAVNESMTDIQVGQTFGWGWDSGNGLITYEYSDRENLDANDRSFSEAAADPFDLLPKQKRHSVFASATQRLNRSVELFGDVLYSNRDSSVRDTLSIFTSLSDVENEHVNALLGGRVSLAQSWQGELALGYSENETSASTTLPEIDFSFDAPSRASETQTFDAKADGILFSLEGGDAKVALGSHYRREQYTEINSQPPLVDVDMERNVFALHSELFFPFVGEPNSRQGMQRLELTLAARFEDYSDFGASTDPKIGLLWAPSNGLVLRGTWGTSFRAPLLFELETTNSAVGFLRAYEDPQSPTGETFAVLARGGNANLVPETATLWTAGFDYMPSGLLGLEVSATYFDVDFEDRIAVVVPGSTAFMDPRWGAIIDRDPDPGFLRFLESQPFSENDTALESFLGADAVVDSRRLNLSSLKVSGLDVSAHYVFELARSELTLKFSGTHLFEFTEQLTSSDVPVDVVDTAFNPLQTRLRAELGWSSERLTANIALNHVGSHENPRVDPATNVDSWNTVDLYFAYDSNSQATMLLSDITVSVSATNLFDKDPPFVSSFFTDDNVNYDPNNASPVGRMLALQLTKRW